MRFDQHNEDLNAVVALDLDGARKKALDADKATSAGLGSTSWCALDFKGRFSDERIGYDWWNSASKTHVPEESADAVQCYENAGAIIFGKTNVPYFVAILRVTMRYTEQQKTHGDWIEHAEVLQEERLQRSLLALRLSNWVAISEAR